MKSSAFWNQAFLAALQRLPAREARDEANLALELALEHWCDESLEFLPVQQNLWDLSLRRRATFGSGRTGTANATPAT